MFKTRTILLVFLCLALIGCAEISEEAGTQSEGEAGPEAQSEQPAPEEQLVVVPAGTRIEVRLTQSISSKKNRSGDEFGAVLEQGLKVGDQVVVPQGSLVIGKLLDVKGSGKVKGRARMSLVLMKIQMEDEYYPIDTNRITVEAKATKRRDAKTIGGATGVGALIGGIAGGKKGAAIGAAIGAGGGTAAVLTTKGKEVEFRPEHKFSFVLEEDLEMKI